jgi:predicted sulfurtransferase
MKVNKEINIKVVPLKLLTPIKILNSLCNVKKIFCQKIIFREGINQKVNGKNKIPKRVLNQLKEIDRMFVEGSKIENKFIIIFI